MQDPVVAQRETLVRQRLSGVNWFVWIAGLSLVNTVINAFGMDRHFPIGLGITEVIDGALSEQAMNVRIVGFVIDAILAGLFLGIWRLSAKRRWPIVIGMIIYFLDGGIYLIAQDWLGVGLHAWALVSIFSGLRAAGRLEEMAIITMMPNTTPVAPLIETT